MGGKESIRGFLYQGFASVLEALTQEFWDKIYVEYPVGDKVDIALESQGIIIKSIQVKSSINLFTKSSIILWIKELIKDVAAKEYSICLIGSCDEDANTFINSINKYQTGIEDAKSKKSLEDFDTTIFDEHDITVSVLPFEEPFLQSIARDALHKYVSFKKYTLEYSCLELIAESILLTQMLLGTKGNSISKEDFDNKIIKWLEITSGGALKSSLLQAKHELVFYSQETGEYSASMTECNITNYYNYRQYIKSYRDNCIKLITEIDSIKLPTHEVIEPKVKETPLLDKIISSNNPTTLKLGEMKKLLDVNGINLNGSVRDLFKHYAEIRDSEKEKFIEEIKVLFDIDIGKEFFFVGNLKEEKTIGIFGQYNFEFYGTDIEKHKNRLINRLIYNKITVYKLISDFISYITDCCVLPIAIHNISNNPDRNITIKLFIPKSAAKLFQGCEYPKDDHVPHISRPFCEESGIICSIFGFKSDSNITVETKNQNQYSQKNYNGEYEYKVQDFYNVLDTYIAQNTYDNSDFYIIEFKVKDGLRPKELKFLNKVILLHSIENTLEIKYKILSDATDGSNEGSITLIKSDNQ